MADFIVRQEAIDDLDEIWNYTKEQWSREQASKYYELLYTEIYRLIEFPLSGKDCSRLGEGYRYSKIKSHFIFYRLDGQKQLEIIRVLHESMDHIRELRGNF